MLADEDPCPWVLMVLVKDLYNYGKGIKIK